MSYFQFKKFTIQQSQCALKVCTDACLFGAWLATKIGNEKRILDIGSGTGLLMLMMAQNSPASIHGIEIDGPSAAQCAENLNASPWSQRLKVWQEDARHFAAEESYDWVISNPPFFENDLKSESQQEKVAKHSQSLNLKELLQVFENNLQPAGQFGLLLPYNRKEEWEALVTSRGWHLQTELMAQQTPKHSYFRWMGIYSKTPTPSLLSEALVIQEADGTYSPAFVRYLAPYYLKL
jgi:tRNA1Val (adenine37-N6)-methyltransferase